MADASGNFFEIQRRAFMWNKNSTLDDGSTSMLWDTDPNNVVDGNTPGETKLYAMPIGGTFFQSSGNWWIKTDVPNTWTLVGTGVSGTTDHSALNNLDYSDSGHTGFASTVDLTTTSGSLQSQIDDKSDIGHIHDDRYYTETEVDALWVTWSGTIDHNTINNYSIDEHRTIDDSGLGATDLWSAQKISSQIAPAETNDTLWSWGDNDYGQLGLGDITNRSSPVQVGSLTTWDKISCGYDQGLAIKTDGTLWSWGRNVEGQLGLGDTTSKSSPVQVGSLTTWDKIAGTSSHTLAIKTDGTLWSWGENGFGELGLEDTILRSSPVQVGSLTTWDKITSGHGYTIATKTDGTLWSWGRNHYGQLGLEDLTNRSSPVQVGSLNTWDKIVSRHNYTAAIKTDGTLWSWGDNTYGPLGLGDTTHRSSPVQVGSLTTWDKVAGGYHTVAIKTDGTLWSWGYNTNGQLGLEDTTNRSSPVQVGALTTWDKIICGYLHTIAIKTDSTLWSWGQNDYGQLGLGDIIWRSSPVQVGSLLTTWDKALCGQSYTVAIKKRADHAALDNLDYASSGHTGFASTVALTTTSGTLQINIDGKSDTSHIHDDRYYTESEVDDLITTISGKLDDHNELNNLDYASSGHTGFQPAGNYLTDTEFSTYSGTLQTQIDGKDNYQSWSFAVDGETKDAITSDDILDFVGGDNITITRTADDQITISGSEGVTDHSALGNLDYASSGHTGFASTAHTHDDRYYTETEVDTISGTLSTEIDSDIITFSGTIDHDTILNTHNLTSDIDHDQLTNYSIDEHRTIDDGDITSTNLWSAEKINSEVATISGGLDEHDELQLEVEYLTLTSGNITNKYATLTYIPCSGTEVGLDMIGGCAQTYGVEYVVDNCQVSWDGYGLDGDLITGDKLRVFYTYISGATCSGEDGQPPPPPPPSEYTLWSWGSNTYGELGLEDTTDRSSPVQVGSLTTWDKIVGGGSHTAALKTDDTLWSWGLNTYGQLGLEDTTDRSSPVQVGSLTTWYKIASESLPGVVAIKTDGTLWSWGYNVFGGLGLGDIINKSSPVQVGSLTTWDKVSCGNAHTIAIKTDGTLWLWGRNEDGQLGLEDTTDRSSPVQVGSLTTWDEISGGVYHTLATKTDGTLWSWGRSNYGQLGLGDTISRSSPVQVGSLTTWDEISGGVYHTLATKTDGTLWSWGRSNYGQLGLGDTISRSSPVQVGSLTTWDEISGGVYHTLATKTDGTLWSWGRSNYGQLGLEDTADRSSPVQVGSLTTWDKVAGGFYHTVAIKTDGV